MKQILLACLIFSCAAVAPAAVNYQQNGVAKSHAKRSATNDFTDHNDADDHGLGFGLNMKHDDSTRPIATGSVKALQIFPINSVTGGLTYNFS